MSKQHLDRYEYFLSITEAEGPAPFEGIDNELDRLQELAPDLTKAQLALVLKWKNAEPEPSPDKELWFERVRKIISELATSRHPRLCSAGIAYACGLSTINGLSMADYAKTVGLTKEAVSAEARRWTKKLGIQPSRYQRKSKLRSVHTIKGKKKTGRAAE